jgi:hypothetical protein
MQPSPQPHQTYHLQNKSFKQMERIRQKVWRGAYDARFLYEFTESMGLDIKFVER